jgi:hypothetical protein
VSREDGEQCALVLRDRAEGGGFLPALVVSGGVTCRESGEEVGDPLAWKHPLSQDRPEQTALSPPVELVAAGEWFRATPPHQPLSWSWQHRGHPAT